MLHEVGWKSISGFALTLPMRACLSWFAIWRMSAAHPVAIVYASATHSLGTPTRSNASSATGMSSSCRARTVSVKFSGMPVARNGAAWSAWTMASLTELIVWFTSSGISMFRTSSFDWTSSHRSSRSPRTVAGSSTRPPMAFAPVDKNARAKHDAMAAAKAIFVIFPLSLLSLSLAVSVLCSDVDCPPQAQVIGSSLPPWMPPFLVTKKSRTNVP
mmetsp:Transcript_7476/g.21526  ORF Transcript_7476/g.21526 Transcript_7476/m.21526 type:complete len:215 (-) Transcript_7476:36-680(-)